MYRFFLGSIAGGKYFYSKPFQWKIIFQ
jgi:hypothetical protein